MARCYDVTRSFDTTIYTCECVEADTRQFSTITVFYNGSPLPDEKANKLCDTECKKMGLVFLTISGVRREIDCYGMTAEEFITHGHKIDPITRKDIEE